jgi:transcriptional regulator with XRE-family HTH domain
MSELVDKLRPEFQDEEYRHSYAEECLNTMIATQIKVLREQREMTQSALARKALMLQPRLSVMESADYSSWSVSTLKRLARAFDLALSVKFEAFSEVILDFEEMSKEALSRPSFKDDPMFRSPKVSTRRRFSKRFGSAAERDGLQGAQRKLMFTAEITEFPKRDARKEAFGANDEPQQKHSSEREGALKNAVGISAIG